jgi:hypothetical protein
VTLYKGHLGVGVTEPSGQLELAGDERIQEYPPRDLYQHDTNIEGHGVFCVSSSAEHNTDHQTWEAFGDNATSASSESVWNSLGAMYVNATGAYTSSTTTSGIKGEWIQMKTPYKVKISSFILDSYATSGRRPRDFVLLGSNDGNVWEQMKSVSGQTTGYTMNSPYATSSGGPHHTVNSTKFYTYFRIVITHVQPSGDGLAAVGRLRFFGTPGPTTLDKGSLTLGRSLDVPRVSRYDVDTETPRPEKLLVDFDTTVNSSPTDISGKGNHGAFYGDAQYSAGDKAFKFDGADDYIQTGTVGLSGTNPVFSVSLWVNYNGGGSETLCMIGDAYNNGTTIWLDIEASNKPRIIFVNNDVSFTDPNTGLGAPLPNVWNHLVYVFNGTPNGGRSAYVNGVKQVASAAVGTLANGNLVLPSSSKLTIGALDHTSGFIHETVGQISNFKLYSVALEPSEVKKLYRLGRTGRSMVISDTAVGIGKVPEAQLDVRGTISCNGAMRITGRDPDFLRIRMANVFGLGESEGQSIPDTNTVMDNGSAIIEYTGGQSTTNNEGAYIWLNGDTMGIMNTGDTNTLHWYDGDVFPDVSQTRHWYISTSGAITNSSDLTLKNNIRYFDDEYDISNSMLNYSQIKFCKYNWKRELKDPSGVKDDFYGVIAQEIEPLFPEMIKTDEGGLKMIQQERLQYISYHMIANLIQKNAALEARILALENA